MKTKLKILLVEDDSFCAAVFEQMMREMVNILAFPTIMSTLAESLERLNDEYFDLIIIDLGLPDSEGLDTLFKVKEVSPGIPIIILSGTDNREVILQAMRVGAQDYLIKGQVDIRDLERSVLYAIERKKAEEILRESEIKHRLLMQSIRAPILALKEDLTVFYCNSAFGRIVGKSPEAMEGKSLNRIFPDFMMTKSFKNYRKVLKDGKTREVEVNLANRYMQSRVYRTPWGVLDIFEDIHDRKLAVAAMEKSAWQIEQLHKFAHRMAVCTDETDLYVMAVEAMENILDSSLGYVGLVENDKIVRKAVSKELISVVKRLAPLESGLAGVTIKNKKTIYFNNIDEVKEAQPSHKDIRSGISVPLGDLGVIQVVSFRENAFTADDVRLLDLLVGHLHESINRIRLQSRLQELAISDPLTGVYNRHYLQFFLESEVKRMQRYKRPIAFLMIDVDRFKEINDRYGHQSGDKVLKAVAEILQEELRSSDILVRYGGDEFLAILLETNSKAEEIKVRIQANVNDGLKKMGEIPISLSIGTSHYNPKKPGTIEDALVAADQAMYEDKKRLEAPL